MGASFMMARAMEMRCRSPPDRLGAALLQHRVVALRTGAR